MHEIQLSPPLTFRGSKSVRPRDMRTLRLRGTGHRISDSSIRSTLPRRSDLTAKFFHACGVRYKCLKQPCMLEEALHFVPTVIDAHACLAIRLPRKGVAAYGRSRIHARAEVLTYHHTTTILP